jgi:hypothetical protein
MTCRVWVLFVMCTVAPTFGQTNAPDLPKAGTQIQRFVDERVAAWRQRLKLEDWQISAVLTRRSDLAPETLGGIHWDKKQKTAVVWVLDPSDYRLPYGAMLDDMELTIVHELVHLDLTALPRGQASRGSEERAVSGIAEAMLTLDRQKR